MKLAIHHTTRMRYDHLISEAYTEVRVAPQRYSGQYCSRFTLRTDPRATIATYFDRHGNEVHHFDVLHPHQQLVVQADSEVVTSPEFTDDSLHLPMLDAYDYLQPTAYAPFSEPIAQLAEAPATADETLRVVREMMERIHTAIRYERGATTVRTSATEALHIGKGVCQDYAHIMIAACRTVRIPARYVSGYIYSTAATEGNAASHAWVDAFIPGRGWMSFDPTHNCEQTATYVRVAVGCDYADVPPTRGVYTGNAEEVMEVIVSVQEA